jgi:hypothetical protein
MVLLIRQVICQDKAALLIPGWASHYKLFAAGSPLTYNAHPHMLVSAELLLNLTIWRQYYFRHFALQKQFMNVSTQSLFGHFPVCLQYLLKESSH